MSPGCLTPYPGLVPPQRWPQRGTTGRPDLKMASPRDARMRHPQSPVAAGCRDMINGRLPPTPVTAVPLGLRMTPLTGAGEISPVVLPLSPMRRVPRLLCSPGRQRNFRCDTKASKSPAQISSAGECGSTGKRKRVKVHHLHLATAGAGAEAKPLRSTDSTPRARAFKSGLGQSDGDDVKNEASNCS